MISSDIIRGYIDIMILFMLLDKPSYGYEVSKNINSLTEGKYLIKETTLYSAFTRLERNGYIKSFSGEDYGNRRTYYRITEEGLEYYYQKCQEWVLTKSVIEYFIRGGI